MGRLETEGGQTIELELETDISNREEPEESASSAPTSTNSY